MVEITDHNAGDFLGTCFQYLKKNYDRTMSNFVIHTERSSFAKHKTKYIAEVQSDRIIHIMIDANEFSVQTKVEYHGLNGKTAEIGELTIKLDIRGILHKYDTINDAANAASRKYVFRKDGFKDYLDELGDKIVKRAEKNGEKMSDLSVSVIVDEHTETYVMDINGVKERGQL